MKHLRIISIIVLSIMSISCSAQKTLSDLASIKGVTSVYVGKAMLKLAGEGIKAADISGVMDMSKLAGKLSSIEIINCEDKRTVSKALPVANKILSTFPFETITDVIDDDTSVEISGVFNGDGEIINMLLIKCVEDDDLTLILMKGEIDLETLQAALQQ